MVFNATFNNISVISWRSVLLMEETGEYKLGGCGSPDTQFPSTNATDRHDITVILLKWR
jgi:hypothetical protein